MLGTGPGKECTMKINLAHIREHAQSGGWVNFAVFDARSSSGANDDNAQLLAQRSQSQRIQWQALHQRHAFAAAPLGFA